MVKRKESIPALVYRGTPVGFGAIPNGDIYAGQLLTITGFGVKSGADYTISTSSNKVVPILKSISAADVKASGTASGTLYKVVGVALGNAPLQSQYIQSEFGKPLQTPLDVTMYTIDTDTDVRRFAWISTKDTVQLWLPYSGTEPSAGDYLTLSSGVDGAVQKASDFSTEFTVGIVMGYQQASSFSGVTVPGIDAYVLTILDLKYAGV